MYNDGFKKLPVHVPVERPGAYHTYHQYVLRAPKRDELREHLKSKGVGSEIYYPLPLHMQECFKYLGCKEGQFPVSERLALESVALPMNSELTDSEANYVIESVVQFYGGGGA
jgi:dTDP-4-amino-4,6-dideoxygalactose transaminase